MGDLQVQSGEIVAHRLFDVCYSMDLGKVEELWEERFGGGVSRSRLSKPPSKAIDFKVPPVLLGLESLSIEIGAKRFHTSVSARIHDFGVVALTLRIPVEGISWREYTALFNELDREIGVSSGNTLWETALQKVRNTLLPAMSKPNDAKLQEDYLIALVRSWNEPVSTSDLCARIDLVELLSGETRPLSAEAARELLKQRFSYHDDDLVVVTWDRAFICEPRGDNDVCDILEVANAQLLELRYYDELLDDELPRMYHLVEKTRRGFDLLSPRRYARLARKLYSLVAEVTELTERVDNALHVTEDVYLARVYTSALETFRVPTFAAAVDRKLSIVRDTYTALFNEVSGTRGEMLEIAIVLLIILEIAITLIRHGT